jgi:hypothetical protein
VGVGDRTPADRQFLAFTVADSLADSFIPAALIIAE